MPSNRLRGWLPALHTLVITAGCSLFAGCGGPPPAPPAAGTSTTSASTADESAPAKPAASAVAAEPPPRKTWLEGNLKRLYEPFTPPTLAELDAKAEWVDRPVLDSLELLKKQLEKEPPLVPIAEAKQLMNVTPEDNKKIVSSFGQQPAKPEEVDFEATIVRHMGGDIKTTNPILVSSVSDFDIASLVGFALFSFDENMKPFAAKESVVSWQTSKDQMLEKVVMRKDLLWSDGKPITAHDVVFSWKTIMSENVPVPAMRSGTDKIRWIEAYDDHTLVYFHQEPLATNVWNISFSVLPKHVYEQSIQEDPTLAATPHHINMENAPVSGGPYQLVRRERNVELVLERREDYYMFEGQQVRDKPYYKTVKFLIITDSNTSILAIKKGTIDECILTPEQWTSQTTGEDFYQKNTKAYGQEWVYFYFGWNCKSKFFNDKRVRQAMAYAFDHKEMLKTLGYGIFEPANGPFHPDSWMAPKPALPFYQQNLDKAEALLAEAGWEDTDGDNILDKEINGKRVPFEFTILVGALADRPKYGALLKDNLSQIGVVCNVKPVEFTVLQKQMIDHNFDAAFGGWGTGTDPDTSENIWGTGQERNYGQYSNPKVDALYAEGRREFDPEKRAKIYAEIHRLIYEDQPSTFLYFRRSFYAFNKNLRGFRFSPRGPYHYGPGFSAIWSPQQPQ